MSGLRRMSDREKDVVIALLREKDWARPDIGSLDDYWVREMDDGGMGSLALVPKGSEHVSRALGRQVSLAEFMDADGVPVSVALNLDREGKLFELDFWKVDFTPLLVWPAPSAIQDTK